MGKKRMLAVLLSLAVAVAAVPVSVFGEEADTLIEGEDLQLSEDALEESVSEKDSSIEDAAASFEEPAAKEVFSEDVLLEEEEETAGLKEDFSAETETFQLEDAEEAPEEDLELTAWDALSWEQLTITVSGKEFPGSKIVEEGGTLDATDLPVTYNPFAVDGENRLTDIEIKANGEKLSWSDYQISYHNCFDSTVESENSAWAEIQFANEYAGTPRVVIEYAIAALDLSNPAVKDRVVISDIDNLSYDYTGHVILPDDLTIRLRSSDHSETVQLTYNEDFSVELGENENGVNANPSIPFTVSGKGNYTGFICEGTYAITPKEVEEGDISVGEPAVFYIHGAKAFDNTGAVLSPPAEDTIPADFSDYVQNRVWDNLQNRLVPAGSFTVEFYKGEEKLDSVDLKNPPEEIGEYRFVILFKEDGSTNFTNSEDCEVAGTFSIRLHPDLKDIRNTLQRFVSAAAAAADGMDLSDVEVTETFTYDSSDKLPRVKAIIEKWCGMYWEAGSEDDMEITCESGPMINAATYTVSVAGKEEEWGSAPITLSVEIVPKKLADPDTGALKQEFLVGGRQWMHSDGTFVDDDRQPITITDTAPGVNRQLEEGKDYELWAEKDEKGKIVRVHVLGFGNYQSTVKTVEGEEQVEAYCESTSEQWKLKQELSLAAPFILAASPNSIGFKDDGYGKGVPREIMASDLIVVETYPDASQDKQLIPYTDFTIAGYDGDTLAESSRVVPGHAGTHKLWLKGAGAFTGEKSVEYVIEGESFQDAFQVMTDPEDMTREALVPVDAPIPELKPSGASPLEEAWEPQRFTYRYWEDKNGNGRLDTDGETEENELIAVITKEDLASGNIEITFPHVGTFYVSVTLDRKHEGNKALERYDDQPVTVSFTVTPRDLSFESAVTVSAFAADEKWRETDSAGQEVFEEDAYGIIWPGRAVKLEDISVSVYDNETEAFLDAKDYTVTMDEDSFGKIGTLLLHVEGIGNCTGEQDAAIRVVTDDLSDAVITLTDPKLPFAEGEKYPIPGGHAEITVPGLDKPVDPGEYTVSFDTNGKLAVGDTAHVKVSAKEGSHYSGACISAEEVEIIPANLADSKVFGIDEMAALPYTGSAIKPVPVVRNLLSGNAVPKNVYTVEYDTETTKVGEHTFTVTAADENYTGSLTGTYVIRKADSHISAALTPATIRVTTTAQIAVTGTYTGELSYTASGDIVSVNESGKVTGLKTGTAAVTVTAAGDESHMPATASITVTVLPAPKNISGLSASLSEDTFTYDGGEKSPAVTVTDGDKILTGGVDYEVTYGRDNHCVNAGTYTVRITGRDAYTGTKTLRFKIKKAANTITPKNTSVVLYYNAASQTSRRVKGTALDGATINYQSNNKKIKVASNGEITVFAGYIGSAKITISSDATVNYKAAKTTVTVTVKPRKVTLKSAKMDGGKVKLTWTENTSGSGFLVKFATNSKFTKNVGKAWVKDKKATSYRFRKSLQKGTKYYVKVRVYKTVSGKNYYSNYSNVKSVTFK